MKELTIEQKAEAYDEAIEGIQEILSSGEDSIKMSRLQLRLQGIFPELKESEDERIRKSIINFLHEGNPFKNIKKETRQRWIAWLEKQGEQKPTIKIKSAEESLGIDSDTYNKIVDECIFGEQKPTDKIEPRFKVGDYIERKEGLGCHAKIIFVGGNVYGCEKLIHSEDESPFFEFMFKNQDEFQISSDFKQKPDGNAEPKFKVGDWITIDKPCQVISIHDNGNYIVQYCDDEKTHELSKNFCEFHFHLWTINDADDGDVLACNNGWTCIFKTLVNDETFSSYCFMDNTKWFCETGSECHTLREEFVKAYNGKIHPATKEQRDLLFSKMKEAGYEWDAKKKELKKIEQKLDTDFSDLRTWKYIVDAVWTQKEGIGQYLDSPFTEEVAKKLQKRFGNIEQKPAWSEEDELHIRELESLIKQEWAIAERKNDKDKIYKMRDLSFFLKTLKPQLKQEWSEEDKNMLQSILDEYKSMPTEKRNWLKSLKDRYTWKPSDEQMKALNTITVTGGISYAGQEQTLINLYNDLKKLKG